MTPAALAHHLREPLFMHLWPTRPLGGCYMVGGQLAWALVEAESSLGIRPSRGEWHISLGSAARDFGHPLGATRAERSQATRRFGQ